eukprot:scaffold994_cov226-Prasinococcus_capsulatus_cf.AAC.11
MVRVDTCLALRQTRSRLSCHRSTRISGSTFDGSDSYVAATSKVGQGLSGPDRGPRIYPARARACRWQAAASEAELHAKVRPNEHCSTSFRTGSRMQQGSGSVEDFFCLGAGRGETLGHVDGDELLRTQRFAVTYPTTPQDLVLYSVSRRTSCVPVPLLHAEEPPVTRCPPLKSLRSYQQEGERRPS